MKEGDFVWYELATDNAAAAEQFYSKVVGWTTADSGVPGMTYTLAKVGEQQVAGLMDFPAEMKGMSPRWNGYIAVADVDATAERIKATGGAVYRAPDDIPGVGRFAVCADPQGAAFMLFKGEGEAPPLLDMSTPGAIGWHELSTTDLDKAWDFYSALFPGWEKSDAMEMPGGGIYQTFTINGKPAGGMMAIVGAPPAWRYYFTVDDIEAGTKRIVDNGGTIQHDPAEVPGGIWITTAADPQGGAFALLGPKI